jgi:hypothetical protein
MSFVTVEVEIDHGRIISRGAEPLPEKATGLLTLLADSKVSPKHGSISAFLSKWIGAFSLPEAPSDDARLAYLLGKHVK